jgi:beta-lactamase regulating signal transducer with metallopeptidase domain
MTLMSLLVKGSLVLAVAAMVQALFARRVSAATRHLIWTIAIIGLLLLPILSSVLPGWTAVRLTTPGTPGASPLVVLPEADKPVRAASDGILPSPVVAASDDSTTAAPTAIGRPWSTGLPVIYAAGMLLLLLRLMAERVSLQRLARRATEVDDPEWARLLFECADHLGVRHTVRLLRSREQTMPMTFGTRRSIVLIPAVADTWSEDRRRAVLLHELAHVARYDCLTQMLAATACAFYWIHPGVWWVARRLRAERELSCDDCVLAAGTNAREYAGHLLELAYTLSGQRAPALAVSMAGSRQLEGRMLAVLDASRNRAVPALRSRLAGVAIMGVLVVPIAAATTTAVHLAGEELLSGAITNRTLEQSPPASVQAARTGSASEQLTGTWEVRPTNDAGMVHLRLTEEDGVSGSTINVEQLDGLAPSQLGGAGGPVRFTVRRDAGAFSFEGMFRNGVGAGTYTFAPNANFAVEMVKRGFEQPTVGEQRVLARKDIGLAFIDELASQDYRRPRVSELVRAAQHGVSLSYLREIGRIGYRLGLLEKLIEQRDHGVTLQFIRGLVTQGLSRLSPDNLLQARDHGVTPEYISRLRALGYQSLDLDRLISLRNHGVSPEFIQELEGLGFTKLSLDALIGARNHGISPEYVRELRALGYTLSLDELTRARNHGVSAEYVRDMSSLGYQRLPLDTLIRLRNHGVSPEYVRELNGLGYARLDIEELVGLRNHGVTPDEIRRANARAGTRLPTDQLRALAAKGWR